ncbi:small subunit ribosomal protein S20 [Desulfosarcina sp. BuS5]|uniref:30S ribosomal protein S20 n=1 Tax=Desulfosarcina sp. BuS5 TaxID=933262 RepID=UPI00047F1188|nr:30S ribosomal protein S20 [Desulfosarcina sp. BuS5]WDN89477.1 small subunit ribosomal protein S20 [Desulfosarcina sp. BuS5]
MANHKSAVKRAAQNEKKRLRNKSIKTRIKNVTKSVQLIIKDKSGDEVAAILTRAQSVIDNAAKKGVIHKNTAARKISRLYKLVNSNG